MNLGAHFRKVPPLEYKAGALEMGDGDVALFLRVISQDPRIRVRGLYRIFPTPGPFTILLRSTVVPNIHLHYPGEKCPSISNCRVDKLVELCQVPDTNLVAIDVPDTNLVAIDVRGAMDSADDHVAKTWVPSVAFHSLTAGRTESGFLAEMVDVFLEDFRDGMRWGIASLGRELSARAPCTLLPPVARALDEEEIPPTE